MENTNNKPHTKKIPKARKMATKGRVGKPSQTGKKWGEHRARALELHMQGYCDQALADHFDRSNVAVRILLCNARKAGDIPEGPVPRRSDLEPLSVHPNVAAEGQAAAATGNIPSSALSAGPSNTAPGSQSPAASSGNPPAAAPVVSDPYARHHPGPSREASFRSFTPVNAPTQGTTPPSPTPSAAADASPPAPASAPASPPASAPAPPPADDSLAALEANAVRTLASGFALGTTWGTMTIVPDRLPRPAPPMEALYGGSSFTRLPLPGYDQVVLENCAQVAHRVAGRLPDPLNRFH